MLSIRPTVAEHAFYVFGRSLHPELFSIYRSRSIERSKYSAKIDITSDGHLVTFNSRSVIMTEVVCSSKQLLPQKRRLFGSHLKGKNVEQVDRKQGVTYHTQLIVQHPKHVGGDMF